MKRTLICLWLFTAVLLLAVYGGAARAQSFTQGDDPLMVTPEILVIVDTSGSMTTQVTDITTGDVLCENNSDGSTCYNCTSTNVCSKCTNSSGSCVSVSGFSNTGNTDPITGRILCQASSTCAMCINSSGSCVSMSGYLDSGRADLTTGREICQNPTQTCKKCLNTSGSCVSVTGYSDSGNVDATTLREICSPPSACTNVTISGTCTAVTGYSDTGKKDSATQQEICRNATTPCTKVIRSDASCASASGLTDTHTADSSTGKEICKGKITCSHVMIGTTCTAVTGYSQSGTKCKKGSTTYSECSATSDTYLDCAASYYVDCTSSNTCLDCTSYLDCSTCLDCSSTCYDSNGYLVYENATPLTRQTAVRQVLTGNYGSCGVGTCCSNQRTDGILDAYKDVIRFGFATYDDDRSYQGNVRGINTWNYPACNYGDSTNCTDSTKGGGKLGIKGRNQGTGSLIDLVDTTNPNDLLGHNATVQANGACTTTASGSTPLNAALWDARYYYQNWQTETGYNDQMDQYGCRAKFVMLLTDGEDNGPTGFNYASAAQEAGNLYAIGIPLFVIGFGNDLAGGSSQLDEMQQAGSGCPGSVGCIPSAFLAQSPSALLASLTTIMNTVLAGQASRTPIVSAPSTTSSTTSYSYQAWMQITASGLGWRGHLVRKPITGIDSNGLPVTDPNTANWIYFENVLANQTASSRNIYTVVNDPRSQTFSPINRPVGTDPVVDLYPFKTGNNPSQLQPLMCLQNTEGVTNAVLMDRIRDFVRGVPGSSTINGNLVNTGPYLGDIFHSSPLIVQPPSALAPDYRYEMFFQQYKNRPSMLYVGANDGMLHAFIAENTDPSATDTIGKELWAFIPTNLLSKIQQTRWEHSAFVDGSPAANDVLFQGLQATDQAGNPLFDSNNKPIMGAYRTVLITGERAGGNAYFALNVSDPYNPEYLWEYRTDVPIGSSYTNPQFQCRDSQLETWSSPIIGQVWLKNKRPDLANGLDYQGRSVMIVPGGYLPPQALTQASSCIEFMEGLDSISSIHVVDIETGKLLKKVSYTNALTSAMQTDIATFYTTITNGDCYNSPGNAACKSGFVNKSWQNNYGSGSGWSCSETRATIAHQLPIPATLLASANCTTTEDASQYDQKCCDTPPTCSTSNACYYHYHKDKTVAGGITVELKTDTCALVTDPNDRGHFTLQIESNFQTESVAATGVAQDTAFGQYITRVFIPTTSGRIFRIDLTLGQYDPTAAEGNMISAYTDPGTNIPYNWDVGRDSNLNPVPWYDTIVDTAGVRRPIMVSPTNALDYDLNLVLFFGSGVIDNLAYSSTWDYVWAVKEGRQFNSSANRYVYNLNGTRLASVFKLPNMSERLFSKPLVLGGDVYFSTYLPVTSACLPGSGYVYGKNFTDLSQDVITKIKVDKFPPQGPTAFFTPTGMTVAVSTVAGLQAIGSNFSLTTARIMHWGRVL